MSTEDALSAQCNLGHEDTLLRIVDDLSKRKGLQKIVLKSYFRLPGCEDASINKLFQAILKHSSSLRYLHLDGIPITDTELFALILSAPLQTIILRKNGLYDNEWATIAKNVKPNFLKELRIEDNPFKTMAALALSELLQECVKLEIISFRGCSLSPSSSLSLTTSIISLRHLREISFYDSDMTDAIYALTNFIGSFTSLKDLDLSSCLITDEPASILVSNIAFLPAVDSVDLSNNIISRRGCEDIVRSLRNSTLKKLSLHNNPFFTPENMQYIIRKLQNRCNEFNCKVYITWLDHTVPQSDIPGYLGWNSFDDFLGKPDLNSFLSIKNFPQVVSQYLSQFSNPSMSATLDLLFRLVDFYSANRAVINSKESIIVPNFYLQDILIGCELILFTTLHQIHTGRSSEVDLANELSCRLGLTLSEDGVRCVEKSKGALFIISKLSKRSWFPRSVRATLGDLCRLRDIRGEGEDLF